MPLGEGRPSGGATHMRVLVDGLDRTAKALRATPKEVQRELPKALRRAAEPARRGARSKAPRASGRLARSIRLQANKSGAFLGSRLDYAPIVEFARRGRYETLTRNWGEPPRFLIPAVEEAAPRIEKDVTEAIQGVLNKAFGEFNA